MLSMLEWLCTELMEVEVDQQLGAEKSQRIVSEVLFQNLEDRGLSTPPDASWQRCKVHFMRNILAYVPQGEEILIVFVKQGDVPVFQRLKLLRRSVSAVIRSIVGNVAKHCFRPASC